MLLFRKSDFLIFKVSNSNMQQIFFRNKTFLFVVQMSWKKNIWQMYDVFVKYLFFQLIRTTNKKVLFLKKIFAMLLFETLTIKKSDFLNSNMCFCSRYTVYKSFKVAFKFLHMVCKILFLELVRCVERIL